MSRRVTPGADRAAQNQQTLKSLVKLESNKSCADCKRNKHPRWASWNLGIFICIRCSGIHRGMGTHISRVKSVDLDSWTDEQLQSMLRWGNSKANKYWEAKLAPGHAPPETKIENFIRTKYDSKRWVMDGPMPDPATLGGEGDDDVPLNVVQEKAKLERSASLRTGTPGQPARPIRRPAPPPSANIDLFGDEPAPVPARPSTTEPAISARPPPPKAPAAPPKQTKPADSLLGLDFLGAYQSAPPPRPTSAAPGVVSPGGTQRSDLKQSILSLYASAPRPAPSQPQQTSDAFGGFVSPSQHTHSQSNASALAGLGDAFGGLSFSSPSSSAAAPKQQSPVASPFASLASPRSSIASPSSLSGGSFFDTKPAPISKTVSPPLPPPKAQPTQHFSSSGFGDFGDFASAEPATRSSPPPPANSSSMGDLFDLASPAPAPAPAPVAAAAPSYNSSAFNLSAPAAAPKPASNPPPVAASGFSNLGGMDAWGSNNAWSTPDPAPTSTASVAAPPKQTSAAAATTTIPTSSYKAPPTTSVSDDFGGWGSNDGVVGNPSTSKTAVVADEDDFGGWSSAAPVTPAATTAPSTSTSNGNASSSSGGGQNSAKGFGGTSDDLFGNVWG